VEIVTSVKMNNLPEPNSVNPYNGNSLPNSVNPDDDSGNGSTRNRKSENKDSKGSGDEGSPKGKLLLSSKELLLKEFKRENFK
jgi:hypothetical protein